MVLTTIFEPGETIYYPNIYDQKGKPMVVKDFYLGRGSNGPYIQYLSDDLLDCLVQEMHENIGNEYDNLVVITGPEGSGKSNLAYWVAKKFDPDFSIQDGYIYDIGPFLEKLVSSELKGQVFWMDEATNLASNRDWMKDSNKSLIQLLEMLRSRGMTIIMCIPKLERLDVYIRETRMRYRLNAQERYWEKDSEKKRGYFELRRRPTFKTVCWGTFAKIPQEEKEVYEKLKLQSQQSKTREIYERYKEENGQTPKLQRSTDNNKKLTWMLICTGYSYQEIEERTGIPYGTLRRWMHEMGKEEDD